MADYGMGDWDVGYDYYNYGGGDYGYGCPSDMSIY